MQVSGPLTQLPPVKEVYYHLNNLEDHIKSESIIWGIQTKLCVKMLH